MTRDVVCVDGDVTLDELAQLFASTRVRVAPVVDDEGLLLGMVSTNDLVRGGAGTRGSDEDEPPFPPNCIGVLADDIMTAEVVSVRESASLADAVRLFAAKRLHRLPVVTATGAVVGMLSVSDVLQWMAKELDQET